MLIITWFTKFKLWCRFGSSRVGHDNEPLVSESWCSLWGHCYCLSKHYPNLRVSLVKSIIEYVNAWWCWYVEFVSMCFELFKRGSLLLLGREQLAGFKESHPFSRYLYSSLFNQVVCNFLAGLYHLWTLLHLSLVFLSTFNWRHHMLLTWTSRFLFVCLSCLVAHFIYQRKRGCATVSCE